jgi:pimeloyl-ACP methyl ester carboxylesterase
MHKIKTIQHTDYQLSYYVFENPKEDRIHSDLTTFTPECILCFHGHGRSGKDYEFLTSKNIKVIAVNLFYHEESMVKTDHILKWNTIKTLLLKLLKLENCEEFHGLAYSQGGRFALRLYQSIPEKFKSLTLIAPDGLDDRSLYNWASRRLFFQELFKAMSKKPESIQKLTKVIYKSGLMRPKVKDFILKFTEDKETIQRAAKAWGAFSSIRPNAKKIGNNLHKYQTDFRLIMGTKDQIIRPQQASYFLKKSGIQTEIRLLECGHNFFKEDILTELISHLPFKIQNDF